MQRARYNNTEEAIILVTAERVPQSGAQSSQPPIIASSICLLHPFPAPIAPSSSSTFISDTVPTHYFVNILSCLACEKRRSYPLSAVRGNSYKNDVHEATSRGAC
jgi:hypothetical protein